MANKKYLVELTDDERAHVWMPRFTQGIYERFGRYDRVQSCVRPQIAA